MRMTFVNRIRVKLGAKWNRNRMLWHKVEIEKENKNAEERENGKRSGKKGKHKKIKWHGDKKRKKDR